MAVTKVIEVQVKDNLDKTQDHFNDLRNEIKKTEQEVEDLTKTFGANSNEVKKATKQLDSLTDAYNDLSKSATDVNASFEDIYGELKPLTARLGEAEDRLYELALAGKQNTQEYRDLLEATANYRRVQIQTDLVVDSAAQTMSQKLGGALEGAASAFALVQGAMGLFGSESEEVEKALLKVQSAMALAQGIEGVRTALPLFTGLGTVIKTHVVTAFSTLKGAIISTGIGALVVGLGFLISKMMETADATQEAADAQEKLNEKQRKSLEIMNEIIDAAEKKRNAEKGGLNDMQRELDLLKARGATEKEIFDKSKAILLEELHNQKVRYESLKYGDKLEREAAVETKELIKNTKNEIRVLEAEYYRNKREQSKKSTKKEKEDIKEVHDYEAEALQNRIRLQNEFYAELENEMQVNADLTKTEQEKEIESVNDKYFRLIELAKQYNQDTTLLEENQKNALNDINTKYANERIKTEKETNDRIKEDNQKLQDAKLSVARSGFQLISELASDFAGKNEKQQRKAFNVQKAANLAGATIDGYKAVTSTYAQTVGGPVLKGIAAGIVGAAAFAQVAKIASTSFDSPRVDSGSGNISGGESQTQAPSFNIVGQGSVGSLPQLEQKPIQAFVVSGEVTSQQALDRNRLRNATL